MKIIYTRKNEEIKVDDEDFDFLSQLSWFIRVNERGYPSVLANMEDSSTASGRRTVTMSRLILRLNPTDPMVDHEDRDPLNNQRSNLRLATSVQNNANSSVRKNKQSSKWKGVYQLPSGRYRVGINKEGKAFYLGVYELEDDAAVAYNHAAKEHFGVFASFNDIKDWELRNPKVYENLSEGVSKTPSGKFRAIVYVKGKQVSLGSHASQELAIQIRKNYINTLEA